MLFDDMRVLEYVIRRLLITEIQVSNSERVSIQENCRVKLFCSTARTQRINVICTKLDRMEKVSIDDCEFLMWRMNEAIVKHCQTFRVSHDDTDIIVANIIANK